MDAPEPPILQRKGLFPVKFETTTVVMFVLAAVLTLLSALKLYDDWNVIGVLGKLIGILGVAGFSILSVYLFWRIDRSRKQAGERRPG